MTYELLEEIVGLGANLTLERSVTHDQLRNLVSLAAQQGAHITVRLNLPYDLIKELAGIGRNQITFVLGAVERRES